MRPVFAAVLFCAAFVTLAHARAQAMIEFCPATLNTDAVRAESKKDAAPSALYGFDLSAMGPRSVTATLAFDTSAGWYKLDVPQAVLSEKDRHYSSISAAFTRRDFVSPVMYVEFPQALKISHAWVYSAAAHDSGPFGWDAQGKVTCDPPAGGNPSLQSGSDAPKLTAKDEDPLNAPPSAASIVLHAEATAPMETSSCADPFEYAAGTGIDTPDYPGGAPPEVLSSSIMVAIDADGKVVDAWIWGPSGYRFADDATLQAAKSSSYKAGRAYCRNVPGLYIFRATFAPER